MNSIRNFALDRKKSQLLTGLAVVSLALAGCAAFPTFGGGSGHSDDKPLADQAPAGFESYYGQTIEWQACEEDAIVPAMMSVPEDLQNYQCATLKAPLNWDDPESESIELGIARHLSSKAGDRPPLFYNLGGPGGGAVDSITGVISNVLTANVAQAFNVYALDPRGVGTSTPIWCLTDEERDEDNSLDYELGELSAQEVVDLTNQEMADLGAQCVERNGDIVGFVDSDSAMRDFDMARAAIGAETMDYIGFSYGTLLGALYADTFPEHVGNFVLDGALDPSLDINQVASLQTAGMEAALYNWIETCNREKSCPLGKDLETGKQTMIDFFDQVADKPLETSDPDRPLTLGLARTAVIGTLYSTALYPTLTVGMQQALAGDGSTLLFMADYFNDRAEDGTYTSNSADSFVAVNSLDYEPVGSLAEWEEEAKKIQEENPVLGGDFGFASAGLSAWPVESRAVRRSVTAADAPPVLIIGTTHDPATPYSMAVSLHEQMQGSSLLTVEGWDHTAYNTTASPCVRGVVDKFLLNGELPAEGTVCD